MLTATSPQGREPLRARDTYAWWTRITTRWRDNDAYGHVNNVIYYEWLDTAVNTWLVEAGLLDIAQGETIGLVVETGCRFASSLSFPEAVEIGLAVDHIGQSSVRYRLGVFAVGAAQASAEGRFVHVYVGRESQRPTLLPQEWRTRLAPLAGGGSSPA